jgi:hypothetical protein
MAHAHAGDIIQTVTLSVWNGDSFLCLLRSLALGAVVNSHEVAAPQRSTLMPKWLHGIIGPTVTLWACAATYCIVWILGSNGDMPKRAELIASLTLPFVISSWVMADARKRGQRLCYDYDSFAYFAWPIVVPIYLFRTRGARAFLTLLCFGAIWLVAILAAVIVFLIREWASS